MDTSNCADKKIAAFKEGTLQMLNYAYVCMYSAYFGVCAAF